jgi:hypothetical protein
LEGRKWTPRGSVAQLRAAPQVEDISPPIEETHVVCFLFFCDYAPPPPRMELYSGAPPAIYEPAPPFLYSAPGAPDGMGGYVPFTNSRVMPDGELRPYDPAIDGSYYVPPPATAY